MSYEEAKAAIVAAHFHCCSIHYNSNSGPSKTKPSAAVIKSTTAEAVRLGKEAAAVAKLMPASSPVVEDKKVPAIDPQMFRNDEKNHSTVVEQGMLKSAPSGMEMPSLPPIVDDSSSQLSPMSIEPLKIDDVVSMVSSSFLPQHELICFLNSRCCTSVDRKGGHAFGGQHCSSSADDLILQEIGDFKSDDVPSTSEEPYAKVQFRGLQTLDPAQLVSKNTKLRGEKLQLQAKLEIAEKRSRVLEKKLKKMSDDVESHQMNSNHAVENTYLRNKCNEMETTLRELGLGHMVPQTPAERMVSAPVVGI